MLKVARKRVAMSRLLRPGEKDDGSFDRAFWQRLGTNAILDASGSEVTRMLRGAHHHSTRSHHSAVHE